MRILCVDGGSRYHLLNSFLDSIATGFRTAGYEVVRDTVWSIQRQGVPANIDFVFSFGAIGAELDWPVPFLSWLVDNPVWSPDLSHLDPNRDGTLVVDGAHPAVMHDFLGISAPAGFLPHGIELVTEDAPDFHDQDRDIDVLLAGSIDANPHLEWTTEHSVVREVMAATITEFHDRRDRHMRELDVVRVFRDAAQAAGLPAVVEGHRLVAPVLAGLEAQVRDYRRLACVRALDAAGVRVTLVGTGWDRVTGLRHATAHAPIDHEELLKLARSAKVVLNAGPPFFNCGWHERIPLALASGAACVTEVNDWLLGDTVLSPLITTYEMPDHAQLGDVVRGVLADPERLERARAGYDLARAQHTWAHRAAMILDIVEL